MTTILQKRSLKSIALVGSILCAVVPATVLGIGSIFAIRSWTYQEEESRTITHAGNLAQLLQQNLADELSAIAVLGQTFRLAGAPTQENLQPLMQNYNAARPKIEVAFFADVRGKILAVEPTYNADGTTSLGVDVSDREYFKIVMARREPYITRDVLVGKSTGRAVIIVAAPAYGANGALIGVVFGSLWVRDLKDIVGTFNYGRTGHGVVTTEKGIVIAHSNEDFVTQRADFSQRPIWPLLSKGTRGPLSSYIDENNVERIGGYAAVPIVGWKVWVSRSSGEIDQLILNNYLSDAGFAVLAVILITLLGAYATRMVVRPIDDVRKTAGLIASGDLSERVQVKGPKEINQLANSVNRMADELQRNIAVERASKEDLEKSVAEFAKFAARVADGDLRARVSANPDTTLDQLGVSLNRMTESLGQLVGEIRDAVKRLASASAEILAATRQQVSATAEEATAIRQTAATVAEVRQAAEMGARKTRNVADMAQKTAATAEDGRKSVEESIHGSDEARQRMEALAERILAFSEQAEAIAEINATVGELAEQSNLLAVNAGIEAAKAGEAGRGFAVVASEVKALAERSKDATIQVRRIVIDLQKSAQSTVIAAEQGVKSAATGAATAQRSGAAISALATSVIEASQAAQQIMATAQQQEAGMDQIAIAVKDIEQSSAQTVAALQQVERAAKDLNDLAERLAQTIQTSVVEA